MERPIFKPIGTPSIQLDTPVLVVDLDVLDRNIATVHSFFAGRDASLRPHIEAHRCPAIAHRQLAAEGTVGGITVNTIGQAEHFAGAGFSDIFIASQVVTRGKIQRLCALATRCVITVAVDNPQNINNLSEAASRVGATVNVVVDVNTRLNRSGVEPGRPAVDLASQVNKADGLHFSGLSTYEGFIFEDVADETRKAIQPLLDTREMMEKAGMEVEVVSAGGTHNYEVVGDMSGITEVPAGSYALMDQRYRSSRPQLQPAAKVLATVTSRPEPTVVIIDTGQKAIGADSGEPVIENLQGAKIAGLSAEHGNLSLSEPNANQPDLGDKLWLIPWDIGTCANLYDYMHVVRNNKLEAVWEVSARGLYI